MPDVIEPKVVENQRAPIVILQLTVYVPGDIVVHFGEVLGPVS